MGLIIHAWWGDRFQTLCKATGQSKVANLVRYTSLPVNCPDCLETLYYYGFDHSKHELMPEEAKIRRISSAIYPQINIPVEAPPEESELLKAVEELIAPIEEEPEVVENSSEFAKQYTEFLQRQTDKLTEIIIEPIIEDSEITEEPYVFFEQTVKGPDFVIEPIIEHASPIDPEITEEPEVVIEPIPVIKTPVVTKAPVKPKTTSKAKRR